jgi:uncharacterized protein (DUF2147 family)
MARYRRLTSLPPSAILARALEMRQGSCSSLLRTSLATDPGQGGTVNSALQPRRNHDEQRGERAMRSTLCVAVLTPLLGATLALAAESPGGTWKTVDDKSGKERSQVKIYEEGGKLFGKITGLTEPTDKAGKPKTCTHCTDADKDKPIIGLVIIRDLSPSGKSYKAGTILDPEDGKVYKAEICVEDGKLKVRDYVGFFYKTPTWLKGN